MKIAVGTPVYSTVMMGYASCLPMLIHCTDKADITWNGQPAKPEFGVFMMQSSILPQLRNSIAKAAAEWGAHYLLWIDSDMRFPIDSLLRLLSHGLPVVGANYPKRDAGFSPTAVGLDGEYLWTTQELAEAGAVEEVQSLGLGFCLVDMQVIHTVASDGKPLFDLELIGDGTQFLGEDYHFFERIRNAGFKVHVDHPLSWHMEHTVQRNLIFSEH